ncbi:hypothetical protein B0T22DRAFT_454003 [Podospora appendiculata]|uniref:Uncharacterized protein n=1 Tax=Podospora appendiculata TaxID=314037 RepID=A0AAE0XKS8_9PEZI|nr:hypothetical protein B0T22DRAFT_454003 [Podospora appendiculata]
MITMTMTMLPPLRPLRPRLSSQLAQHSWSTSTLSSLMRRRAKNQSRSALQLPRRGRNHWMHQSQRRLAPRRVLVLLSRSQISKTQLPRSKKKTGPCRVSPRRARRPKADAIIREMTRSTFRLPVHSPTRSSASLTLLLLYQSLYQSSPPLPWLQRRLGFRQARQKRPRRTRKKAFSLNLGSQNRSQSQSQLRINIGLPLKTSSALRMNYSCGRRKTELHRLFLSNSRRSSRRRWSGLQALPRKARKRRAKRRSPGLSRPSLFQTRLRPCLRSDRAPPKPRRRPRKSSMRHRQSLHLGPLRLRPRPFRWMSLFSSNPSMSRRQIDLLRWKLCMENSTMFYLANGQVCLCRTGRLSSDNRLPPSMRNLPISSPSSHSLMCPPLAAKNCQLLRRLHTMHLLPMSLPWSSANNRL